MKKLVSMLLASVMTFSTFGMVAFADDGQQSASAGSKTTPQTQSVTGNSKTAVQSTSKDISKYGLHLGQDSFMYDPSKGNSYEDNENFASVDDILNQIECDDEEFSYAGDLLSNLIIKIGNTTYDYDKYEKNQKVYLKPGKYNVVITGKGQYTGKVELPFEVHPFNITSKYKYIKKDVNLGYYASLTYNGKAQKPKVNVAIEYYNGDNYDDIFLKEGRDYTATYKYKNNKNYGFGSASVEITFKGCYAGTIKKTLKFGIYPQSIKTSKKAIKVKAGKKSVKLKWKKTKDASGYKVIITKDTKKGSKVVKTKTLKGRKKTSCTIKGLKRHTKYSACIRPYRNVKGKKLIANSWGPGFRTK